MAEGRLAIRGGRVIDPAQGIDRLADVMVRDGVIERVTDRPLSEMPGGYAVLDASGLVLTPGFIDVHTHLREPGEEHKETIETGTTAAVQGGFTTVCAMPNTSPAQDTASVIEDVLRRAVRHGRCRVLAIGAVTVDRAGARLTEMAELADAGVVGFSDDGNPVSDSNIMRQALAYAGRLGLPIINHCEERSLAGANHMNEGAISTRLGLAGAPPEAEAVMVARDIALARITDGRLHIAHVSARASVEHLGAARRSGLPVTADVTPHHLTLTDDWVLGRHGGAAPELPLGLEAFDTNTKVNPPLRSRDDVEAVVEALANGTIDIVATDHAPHAETDKACTYAEAAHGIANLETAFASVMSLVHGGAMSFLRLIECLTSGPARFLNKDLGTLRPGFPADLAILDPGAEWIVDPTRFASRGRNTPLAGQALRGQVMATVYGGNVVYRSDVYAHPTTRSSAAR